MRIALPVLALCSLVNMGLSFAGQGVSPFLPLNLDPALDAKIQQALILADQPVLKRPISVAALRAAMPAVCELDPVLCEYLEQRLAAWFGDSVIAQAGVEIAATGSANRFVPNRYGLDGTSPWTADGQIVWQPGRYASVSAGAVAYDGELTPVGSMLSLGTDWAQLDLGYRAHWLSPLTGSSSLFGTESPALAAVTLSNSRALTRFGMRYEAFLADLSYSSRIAFRGGFTEGRPKLAGLHLSIEPARGWSIGLNRLLQYGGGDRGGQSLRDLFNAFLSPGQFDNVNSASLDNQFGNQLASVVSSFVLPGRRPVAVYLEYSGEDTSRGRNYLLGNAALSAGIHWPRFADRFDLSLEVSEWQNGWYTNSLYGDGLMYRGRVIGHWGGNARMFGDDVGARSAMVRLGWDTSSGSNYQLRFRTLQNEAYGRASYVRAQEFSLQYTRPWRDQFVAGLSLEIGRDVFAQDYGRLAAIIRYSATGSTGTARLPRQQSRARRPDGAEWFVEMGVAASRVTIDLDDQIPRFDAAGTSPHFAIGARRSVSARQDLGVRLDIDEVDGRLLAAVRAVDYRYRFASPLAVNAFVGAARYDLATPAYGLWAGAGISWRDLIHGWDMGLEARFGIKVARDDLVAADPAGGRPDSFYDIESLSLSLTRRF